MNANNFAFLGDMFTVISVSRPVGTPAVLKCADVTELMGMGEEVTYCPPPGQRTTTQTEAPAHAQAHTYSMHTYVSSVLVTCVCIELISTAVHFPHGKAQ